MPQLEKFLEVHPITEEMFALLIEREAKIIGVEVNSDDLSAQCFDNFIDVVNQQAFDVIQGWLELRDSLPFWENSTGDVPSIAETAGTRL